MSLSRETVLLVMKTLHIEAVSGVLLDPWRPDDSSDLIFISVTTIGKSIVLTTVYEFTLLKVEC